MASTHPIERTEVYEKLDQVNDPELDESIVELQYIDQVELGKDSVTIQFRLPTAWCSPAFAWMMATGIRDEVGAIPGVDGVSVRLIDHMHGEEITRGVNQRQAFQEVFDDAESDVEAVRKELNHKARLARQYRAMSTLLNGGVQFEQIARLTRGDIEFKEDQEEQYAVIALPDEAPYVVVSADPIKAYLEKAEQTTIVEQSTDRLFKTPDGSPMEADEVERVYARARLANSNMDGQKSICSQLNESRYEDIKGEKAG